MHRDDTVLIDRALIVGLGSIGKRHLRLARELLPNADIRVLRRQLTDSVPEYANGCFSCIKDAIAFAPQIGVIANPATLHVDSAQSLADAGVHLLVEKPLSASLNGISELLETCKKKRIVLLTGYNLRFLPSLRQFKEFINGELIGKVLSVRCEIGQHLQSWRPDAGYQESVSARRELGGGALLELSHELDYLRWIFGEVEWISAMLSRQSSLIIDVEDTAHLILGFVPADDGRQLIASVNMDFLRHDTTRLCTAIGEKGSLRWNGLTGVVDLFEGETKAWRKLSHIPHHRDDSYLAEWQHFLSCIKEQTDVLISGEDGMAVLQIVEAARQSSKTARRAQVSVVQEKKFIING